MAPEVRIGQGFDVHRFRRGRKLLLGGIEIPFDRGLAGHSDADVVLHALINALLGAMGEGDIGVHFPDTDPRYKNISSLLLLQDVTRVMRRRRFELGNADLTILAQQPKLAPYYGPMKRRIAAALKVSESKVNLKAATTEKLGSIGRSQAIAASAVVLLHRR